MKIKVSVNIDAPISWVWDAYVSPSSIEKWNFASDDWQASNARVDLRVGGEFSSRMEAKDGSEGFDFAGTYTTIINKELIEYSFGDRTASVSLTQTPSGVLVEVSFDPEDENPVELQRLGWQSILNNFADYVVSNKPATDPQSGIW